MTATLEPLVVPTAVTERLARIDARPIVLDVRSLGKTFRATDGSSCVALEDVSFRVRRREFITVIGPSGCGKSTLIRILAGLEEHSSGDVLLDGNPVMGPGCDRGMVFQGYTLFPWLSVLRNVMFGLEMGGMGRDTARSEALQWLDVVGLSAKAEVYPHQLSGGQRQRVAIARALANRPRILLMDEPFGALDAQTRSHLQEHLLQIWQNVNVTILFITHDLDEAAFLADRIVVLGAPDATHAGGHLVEVIDVPLPVPRRREHMQSPEFAALRRRLDVLIHPPSQPAEPIPVYRMTPIGDDVL
jgi:NitT/TauT family transport system ATP-binding protein